MSKIGKAVRGSSVFFAALAAFALLSIPPIGSGYVSFSLALSPLIAYVLFRLVQADGSDGDTSEVNGSSADSLPMSVFHFLALVLVVFFYPALMIFSDNENFFYNKFGYSIAVPFVQLHLMLDAALALFIILGYLHRHFRPGVELLQPKVIFYMVLITSYFRIFLILGFFLDQLGD